MSEKDTWTKELVVCCLLLIPLMGLCLALGFCLGMISGIEIVGGIGPAMAFLTGLVVSFILVGLVVDSILKDQRRLIKKQREIITEQNKCLERNSDFLGKMVKKTGEGFSKMIDEFFEGSPIQNHIVHFTAKGTQIKIGDNNHMVEVDAKIFKEDPIAALERAVTFVFPKCNHLNFSRSFSG